MKLFDKIYKKICNSEKYIDYLRKQGVSIEEGCIVDKTAFFGSEPWLIRIGKNTRIARGVQFITHDGGLWTLRKNNMIDENSVKYGSIKIGDNCNISWNVILMPNITIGDNCIIAAGAVVTKNIPDNTIWGGVPAKQIETLEEYLSKVEDSCVPTNFLSDKEKKEYLIKNKPELFR